MENNKFLGEEKISKLLLKFSIPCILSLLISSLYNIVDQIFIGNSYIGYLGNTATSIVYPITIITMAVAWCLGDGAAAYLSLCQGRKDTKNAHIAIGNSILINFILSIIFVILGFIFMDKLLYLFGASAKSIPLARDYFKIILMFIPAYMLGNVVNGTIRADGSPRFSMIATLSGAVTNIILDPIFIFPLKLGIKGAAWATIIGQCITMILSLYYFTKTKTFKLSLQSFKLNFKLFSNVIKLGVSTFITQLSIVIISLVCNLSLAKYGATSKYGSDIPIATIGICMKVFSIVINIIVGVVVGAQPILGYNYGAKNYKRVKETFKLVLAITIIVGLIATLLFEICPEFIINIFGFEDNPLYIEFAVLTFRIFLMLVTFTCTMKMISIFFQAVGDPVKATITSLVRDILLFVPLVLVLPMKLGIVGVLWAAPVADFGGILVAIVLVIIFFHGLNKNCQSSEITDASLLNSHEGIIITIARTHGTKGKYIGELVAKELNIPYYYKEIVSLAAQESGLDKEFISKINETKDYLHELYLTSSPVKYAIMAQEQIIKKIAENGSCVLVGRAADYVLKDNPHVVKIYIYAKEDVCIKNIMEMYHDNKENAKKNIARSNKNRASYYKIISSKNWSNPENYDLCIDASIGPEKTKDVIIDYLKNIKKD